MYKHIKTVKRADGCITQQLASGTIYETIECVECDGWGHDISGDDLQECIESCGTPTSTVAMRNRVAVIGPIVEPHGMLLCETNTWCGTPAVSHARRNMAAVADDVAYR